MKHYDYLIVGSGLFGATFAYCAAQARKSCFVIDRRPHLGGNVRCEPFTTADGTIHVHQYGPHIFHTSNRRVWQFVNSLVDFAPFINSPLARYGDKLYNLPFNMNTFHQMWGCITPDQARRIIDHQRGEAVRQMQADGITEPRNLEEQALLLVGRDIYERLIKGYTEKQWGRPCSQLPAFIIRRLPVRFTYDNNYFRDPYQGIPVGGYNALIDRLLKHADTQTDTDYFDDREYWNSIADHIVYTGPLDQYFDYQYGHLEWRSCHFDTQVLDTPDYQGVAVVNYTDAAVPFTRIIEHKHFAASPCIPQSFSAGKKTVITREYPCACPIPTASEAGAGPLYPINDRRNTDIADRYRALAAKQPHVTFGGRLADYRYYDMDAVIASALNSDFLSS